MEILWKEGDIMEEWKYYGRMEILWKDLVAELSPEWKILT